MNNLVIYHANCDDGFGAAWAARQSLPKIATDFLPMHYGDAPPWDRMNRETNLYILDFSFPRAEFDRMVGQCSRTVLLDHHRTAFQELAGKNPQPGEVYKLFSTTCFIYLDIEHSGAMLSWNHFNPGPAPALLQYIEDNDLWRHAMPMSKEVNKFQREIQNTLSDSILDKQGRVIITPLQMCIAGITKNVTIIGRGRHLEIWDTKRFEEYIGSGERFDEAYYEAVRTGIRLG